MAYSNWGAFVFRNGERRKDREDVPAFGDASAELAAPSGVRIFVNLLKAREKYGEKGQPPHEHCQHAVLGDGAIRLCGRKSYPVIFEALEDGTITERKAAEFRRERDTAEAEWSWYDSDGIAGEINGYRFEATPGNDPEKVELTLTEPDGTKWTGTSGYCMGAGYEDEP